MENRATPLGIILGKSLKRTRYDIKKHRVTKFFCVIFFHFEAKLQVESVVATCNQRLFVITPYKTRSWHICNWFCIQSHCS